MEEPQPIRRTGSSTSFAVKARRTDDSKRSSFHLYCGGSLRLRQTVSSEFGETVTSISKPMKKVFPGLALGFAAGTVLGVLICLIGFGVFKHITSDQEARDAEIQKKIETKAAPWAGTFLSEPQIAELAKIYLADKHSFGLVIGISSNSQTRIYGYGRISSKVARTPDGNSVFEIG